VRSITKWDEMNTYWAVAPDITETSKHNAVRHRRNEWHIPSNHLLTGTNNSQLHTKHITIRLELIWEQAVLPSLVAENGLIHTTVPHSPYMLHCATPFLTKVCPSPWKDLDIHLIHSALGIPDPPLQTNGSYGSLVLSTTGQNDDKGRY